jgi:iron complex transport system permease protein
MAPTRWTILLFLLTGLFLTDIALGSVEIPLGDILSILFGRPAQDPIWTSIIMEFRLTKAITCVFAGAALSISGLLMQTLFRNPLAGPDVLGLSSGASLAVSLVFMGYSLGFALFSISNSWAVALAASLGSTLVFLLVLAISSRLRNNASLLIVGLMIGAGTSSIVSVLQFLSKAEDLQTYMIWTFGSLGSLSWPEIRVLGGILVMGAVIALASIKSLNAWLLGVNYAQGLGVNIKRARILIIVSTSILTGGVTAFCGPIAFVGLAVPHLVKMLFKTQDHKILIPSVMAGGAILLLFCDIIAQLPGSNQVLPINALTALIGAPVVIWVILKTRMV